MDMISHRSFRSGVLLAAFSVVLVACQASRTPMEKSRTQTESQSMASQLSDCDPDNLLKSLEFIDKSILKYKEKNYDEATTLAQEAVHIVEEKHGADSECLLEHVGNVAAIRVQRIIDERKGEIAHLIPEAQKWQIRALSLRIAYRGKDDPDAINFEKQTGDLFGTEAVRAAYEKAILILESKPDNQVLHK